MKLDAAASISLLLFFLDQDRYAIALSQVDRVYPVVEITGADTVSGNDYLGFVNLHGELIPVINTRLRLGLPEKEIEISDMLIMILDGSTRLALIVDSVGEVLEYNAEQMVMAASLLYSKAQVSVISVSAGNMVVKEMREYLIEAGCQWLKAD